MSKLSALLATGRISNLPTVWCNCLTAAMLLIHLPVPRIGIFGPFEEVTTFHILLAICLVIISSTLLYVGGCFLGDALDTKFDKKHKPTRPIPSGILSKKAILTSAWLMLLLGLVLPVTLYFINSPLQDVFKDGSSPISSSWQHMTAVPFLFSSIVLYSVFHKKTPLLGLPLIGLCRFTLIMFAASIAAWLGILQRGDSGYLISTFLTYEYLIFPILLYASVVCIYTIAFASVARTESSDSPISWRGGLRYLMLALPFAAILMKREYADFNVNATFVAVALYMLWMSYAFIKLNKNKGEFVAKSLAGFCLLDACFIAQFGWMWLAIALGLFGLSLLLQKVAPAT